MKPLVLASITLVALSSFVGCRHSRVVPAEVTDTEYQVLSAYTAAKYKTVSGVRQLVIFGETQIFSETQAVRDDFDSVSDANESIRALRPAYRPLFRAFFAVNRNSSNFRRTFTLPFNYQIADSVEMRSMFGTPGDVWGRYYQKYPGSQGILKISRVGFSPDGRQAAFYFSNHCGGLCGAAKFVIMEKQADSTWKIVEDVLLWIS